MGNEHSTSKREPTLNPNTEISILKREAANSERSADSENDECLGRPRSISPGPSLSSDLDLPYISYTVNRPIGDSPKLQNKQLPKSKVTPRKIPSKQKRIPHNIVLVNPAQRPLNIEKDSDILRLQSIPMFLPIMRATLNLPAARDPEVLERLDPVPLHRLCTRYQSHLTTSANLVAKEQNILSAKMRETDNELTRIFETCMAGQEKLMKYTDKFNKVQELSSQLTKCHTLLNEILESMETLNNYLNVEDRIEPFVWTTG